MKNVCVCGIFYREFLARVSSLKLVLVFFVAMFHNFVCQAMQQPGQASGKLDPKQVELAVYKKFFLPADVQEFFTLHEKGDANPFPRTLLVHAPYSMRPSLIARAIAEHYGPEARYEKFLGWNPTLCADMQRVITARLEQDAHAPILVHINDLARAGRSLCGKKNPGCAGVVENVARSLQRYFGREGDWKNSPVLLIASTTDLDILPADLKSIFEKKLVLAPVHEHMRQAALTEFLQASHKTIEDAALGKLSELTREASFEDLRRWSEELVKRALLTPTTVITPELVEQARVHVQPLIDAEHADEQKLRAQLQGFDEQKDEVAKKKVVLADLVQLLIPKTVTTLVERLTAEAPAAECPVKLVLLSGPAGVGKRTISTAFAATIGAEFQELSLNDLFNPASFVQENTMLGMVDELKKKIKQCAHAHQSGKIGIVFLENLDLVTQVQGSLNSVDRGLLELRKKCLLDVLHAVQASERLLCLATTHAVNGLDPDICNAFYCQIAMPLPDAAAREEVLRMRWRALGDQKAQAGEAPNFAQLAKKTEHFSCQNLVDLVGHAAVQAYLDRMPVSVGHLEKSLKDIVTGEKAPETPLHMYQ